MKIFFLSALIVMSIVVIISSLNDFMTGAKSNHFTEFYSIGVGVFVIIFCAVVLRKELKRLQSPSPKPQS